MIKNKIRPVNLSKIPIRNYEPWNLILDYPQQYNNKFTNLPRIHWFSHHRQFPLGPIDCHIHHNRKWIENPSWRINGFATELKKSTITVRGSGGIRNGKEEKNDITTERKT